MKFLILCLQADTSHAEQRQNVNINMFDHGHALRAVLPTLGWGGERSEAMHANTTAQGLCQNPLLCGGEKGVGGEVSNIVMYRL